MHYRNAVLLFIPFSVGLFSCNQGDTKTTNTRKSNDSNRTKLHTSISSVANTNVVNTKDTSEDAIDPVKLTGALQTSLAEYLDVDGNGDNELLITTKGKDTTSYILETQQNQPALNRGDYIRIKWKNGMYRPAGDPEFPIKATFALGYELVRPGQLSIAKKKGMPRLNSFYYDEEISDTAKGMIDREIRNYLATTPQPDIRAEVDGNKGNLLYSVEKKTNNDKEFYEITISLDGTKPVPIHRVYYSFEQPYQLYDQE